MRAPGGAGPAAAPVREGKGGGGNTGEEGGGTRGRENRPHGGCTGPGGGGAAVVAGPGYRGFAEKWDVHRGFREGVRVKLPCP